MRFFPSKRVFISSVQFLIKFLGSIYFTFGCVGASLLFVIVGTILESLSDSHRFASLFTYNNPTFQALFWMFFINILIAALNRIPFKKTHIPFLCAHLGLLMIFGGTFIKNHFGLQGSLELIEGSSANHCLLPHTFSLSIEDKKERFIIPLSKQQSDIKTSFNNLQLTLLHWIDNASLEYLGWTKENDNPQFLYKDWHVYITKEEDMGSLSPELPALVFIKEKSGKEHIIAINEKKEVYEERFDTSKLSNIVVIDKGFGGYERTFLAPFLPFQLSMPLIPLIKEKKGLLKKEEEHPALVLKARSGHETESLRLIYDPHGHGLKWPILDGKYLVSFQSEKKMIPHTIRLREARKLIYPNTEDAFSYESDLVIDGKEVTISMNEVYETEKGYRFYMANLSTPKHGAKRAHIIVNRDPAKYFMTYPGSIILGCGIILLFLKQRYV